MIATPRREPTVRWVLYAALALGLVAACNAVSGVDDYDFGATSTTTGSGASSTTSGGGHGTGGGAGAGASTTSAGGCGAGDKECPNGCFAKDDPTHGCAAAGCDPCSLPNTQTAACTDGDCAVGTCEPGFDDCTAAAGCETDTSSDAAHCGDCATSCSGGDACCSSSCKDTVNDPHHCGTCGNACKDTEICSASACACRPGLTQAGASCFDFDSDPNHCGGPTTVCSGGTPKCDNGICVSTCGASSDCSDACVNKEKDPLNCGSCGSKCKAWQVCIESNCVDWQPAPSCNQCPCAECTGSFSTCCVYPSATFEICVQTNNCPD